MAIIKKGKYIRIDPHVNKLLKKLKEKLNDSESNVIGKAIIDLAKKEKIEIKL